MKILIVILFVFVLINPFVGAAENQTQTAWNAIQQAERDIEELSGMEFGIVYFNDTLNDAKKAFEGERYDLVLEKTEEITDRKERTYSISDSLNVLEMRIQELDERGLKISEAKELFDAANSIFRDEMYDNAETLILQTSKKLDDIEAESTTIAAMLESARDNIVVFVKENWQLILAVVVISFLSGFFIRKRLKVRKMRNKLKDMKLEKRVLEGLIKEAHSNYFKEKSIGRKEYELATKTYKDRIIRLKRQMPVLEARLKKGKAKPEEKSKKKQKGIPKEKSAKPKEEGSNEKTKEMLQM